MTMHAFSHFIQIWLFPPGLILWLMLCGFILARYTKRLGKVVILFGFILLWTLSTPFMSQALIDRLQYAYLPLKDVDHLALKPQSAIVVLGSGAEAAMEYDSKHTVSERTLSRLHYAVYLHNKTHLPIIVSGGNRDQFKRETEGKIMLDILNQDYKIASQWSENASRTTDEESRFLVPLLKQYRINTIYIVTNAWHMPRSMYVFERAFKQSELKAIPAPMGYITLRSNDFFFSNCLPILNALNTSVFALHEYVGLVWYHFFKS